MWSNKHQLETFHHMIQRPLVLNDHSYHPLNISKISWNCNRKLIIWKFREINITLFIWLSLTSLCHFSTSPIRLIRMSELLGTWESWGQALTWYNLTNLAGASSPIKWVSNYIIVELCELVYKFIPWSNMVDKDELLLFFLSFDFSSFLFSVSFKETSLFLTSSALSNKVLRSSSTWNFLYWKKKRRKMYFIFGTKISSKCTQLG